ncbi:MAG: V4R domain-containing protein [Candidatus Atabeyarchaeum deiterrae]
MKADEILDALASRQFKRLVSNPSPQAKLRKRLGNNIDMWAYQERVIGMLALSKSMGPVLFEAGKKVGKSLSKKAVLMFRKLPNYRSFIECKTLEEAQRSTEWSIVQAMYQMTATGIINMVKYEKGKLLVFQVEECVSCSGLPNLGESVCYYLGGQLCGAIEIIIGKSLAFVETKCQAKGDTCCEFKYTVL